MDVKAIILGAKISVRLIRLDRVEINHRLWYVQAIGIIRGRESGVKYRA